MRRRSEDIDEGDLLVKLQRLCRGLTYTSETDAPIVPFRVTTAEAFLPEKSGTRKSQSIEKVDLDLFFDRLIAERDWHDAAKRRTAKRFARLKKFLEDNLENVEVWRIGRIRIEIFVFGRHASGENLIGVRTEAVET